MCMWMCIHITHPQAVHTNFQSSRAVTIARAFTLSAVCIPLVTSLLGTELLVSVISSVMLKLLRLVQAVISVMFGNMFWHCTDILCAFIEWSSQYCFLLQRHVCWYSPVRNKDKKNCSCVCAL